MIDGTNSSISISGSGASNIPELSSLSAKEIIINDKIVIIDKLQAAK